LNKASQTPFHPGFQALFTFLEPFMSTPLTQRNPHILVTGASGNIGTELVEQLRAAGTAFSTLRSKGTADASTRVASYDDVDALTRAFEGVDTLFLLLPLVENKLTLAANAALAARRAGVRHIVRSSGAGADAASAFALPRLQGKVDELIAATGIATTFIRPAAFMQNFSTWMAGQVKAGTVYAAHGNAVQSLVDTRDIAAVAAQVLQNPALHAGKAYTLTGGQALTTGQFVAEIAQATGRPVNYQPVSFEQAVQAMAGMGMPGWMVELLDSLNRIVAAGYAADVSPDTANLLGRAPITAPTFARDHVAAWKD
jgi:uncharacterized protein YbjT (DUF2867 family)